MWRESTVSDEKTRSKGPESLRIEYGDFQTPLDLGREICDLLARRGLRPSSILEPNCGKGSFLIAARESFPYARSIVGVEINPQYVEIARSSVSSDAKLRQSVTITLGDFFKTDWRAILDTLPEPLLILGNPPWVTNAALTVLGSSNLPTKSNFQNHRGLDAMTGKSNFDISESMLIRELEWICGRRVTLAMICKMAVARKILRYACKHRIGVGETSIYRIDAGKHFGVTVEACLLIVEGSGTKGPGECSFFDSIQAQGPTSSIAYRDGILVSDARSYDRWKHLEGKGHHTWRSGIKHDCAKIMELRRQDGKYRNSLGEIVDVEEDYVYPMLKSSDLAHQERPTPRRFMLVTQHQIGEDTRHLKMLAPNLWEYLTRHAQMFYARSSSVYRHRPPFSIFGVGTYSFSEWKVAISGFYKRLDFRIIGPYEQKPVVLDDTCYFVPCHSQQEAELVAAVLNSAVAREFFASRIFWDEKRPITLGVLSSLDIPAAAREIGLESPLRNALSGSCESPRQLKLFT